jgi:hypothetical protein
MVFTASPFVNLYNDNLQAFLRFIGYTAPEQSEDLPQSSFDLVRRSIADMTKFESITEWTQSLVNNYWKFANELTRSLVPSLDYSALEAPKPLLMIEDGSQSAGSEGYEAPAEQLEASAGLQADTTFESAEEPTSAEESAESSQDAVEPVRSGRSRRKSVDAG